MTTAFDLRTHLQPSRLTIAMWDVSYLNGHYPSGPFADWEQATDDLLARGFNTVRIETYPWIIGRLRAWDESATIVGKPHDTWGHADRDRAHPVADEVYEFLRLCRRKKLWVILSTCAIRSVEQPAPGSTVAEVIAVWQRTLALLEERGLLDRVLYVDVDQEFPFFSALKPALDALAAGPVSALDAMAEAAVSAPGQSWNAAQKNLVRDYFCTAVNALRARFPGLRFTVSLTAPWIWR